MAKVRRWCRGGAVALAASALLFGAAVLVGAPVSYPFDLVLNCGPVVEAPDLRPPADGTVRVVVLQHGLFRTATAFDRLARTLAHHGYEVLAPGYASTRGTIAGYSERLHQAIAARRARGRVDEWSFVGHSMGGLVIQDYLRRGDAVAPVRCVYLGTPHRGAMLVDLRKRWFLFRWAMGSGAALQLSPADALHQQPLPWVERSGALIGDLGEGNPAIPGNDDGTVAVGEARLPGAAGEIVLAVSHTGMTVAGAVLRQVLHFLAKGAFAPGPGRQ